MEAQPESISELYSRDVETMSDEDIDRIIDEQRAQRARMESAEMLGKRAPREGREPRVPKGPTVRANPDIRGLEDIQL